MKRQCRNRVVCDDLSDKWTVICSSTALLIPAQMMFSSLIGPVARPSFRFPSPGHGDPGQLGGSLLLGTASADAISKLGRPQLHFWDAFVHHPSVICVISKTTVVQWVTSVGRSFTDSGASTDNPHSAE